MNGVVVYVVVGEGTEIEASMNVVLWMCVLVYCVDPNGFDDGIHIVIMWWLCVSP